MILSFSTKSFRETFSNKVKSSIYEFLWVLLLLRHSGGSSSPLVGSVDGPAEELGGWRYRGFILVVLFVLK